MDDLIQITKEDETLTIGKGGLYSPFPIPAYKILVAAGQHVAKDVLTCLVSHMGKSNKKVTPSIKLIMREAGRSKSAVINGIRTLQEFGFVKKLQIRKENNKLQNIYFLQDSCWNNDRMNREAIAFAPVIGRCRCGSAVRLGEIGLGQDSYHHWGCGDIVDLFSTRSESRVDRAKVAKPLLSQI